MQELRQQLNAKGEGELSRVETEHRQALSALRDELVSKDEKIKSMEKSQLDSQIEKARAQEHAEQVKLLQGKLKMVETNRDLLMTER